MQKMEKWRWIYTSNRLANISIYTPKVATLNVVRLLYRIVKPLESKELASSRRTSFHWGQSIEIPSFRRGYSEQLLDLEINRTINTSDDSSLSCSDRWNSDRISLVPTDIPSKLTETRTDHHTLPPHPIGLGSTSAANSIFSHHCLLSTLKPTQSTGTHQLISQNKRSPGNFSVKLEGARPAPYWLLRIGYYWYVRQQCDWRTL